MSALPANTVLPRLRRFLTLCDSLYALGTSVGYLERAFFRLMTAQTLGVWCEDKTNQEVVDRLEISHSNRLEAIPASIGRLSHLITLVLTSNKNLVGPIPDLSGLVNLRKLNLTKNALSGTSATLAAIYKSISLPLLKICPSRPLSSP